jgi:hypothetical protein
MSNRDPHGKKGRYRIPRWAPQTFTVVGSTGLFIFGVTHLGHGVARTIVIGVAVVLYISTFIGPELARRIADEDARLAVDFDLTPPLEAVPSYSDPHRVTQGWLDTEREKCLACLSPAPKMNARPKTFDVGAIEGGSSHFELMEYERREKSGETLTAEERQALEDARSTLADTIRAASTMAFAINVLSEPDKRTEAEYRSEVNSYIELCRKAIDQGTDHTYMATGLGRFCVRLHNPSKRTFERVQLEVTIPGKVWAFRHRDRDDPDPFPLRPRKFGERRQFDMNAAAFSYGSLAMPPLVRPSANPPRPVIEHSNGASIKYPPVTIRARGSIDLDEIHIFTTEPAGTALVGKWEATATNADDRIPGTFELAVGQPIDRAAIIDELSKRVE